MKPRHFNRRPVNHQPRPLPHGSHIFYATQLKMTRPTGGLRTNRNNGQNGSRVITLLYSCSEHQKHPGFPGAHPDHNFVEHHSPPTSLRPAQFPLKRATFPAARDNKLLQTEGPPRRWQHPHPSPEAIFQKPSIIAFVITNSSKHLPLCPSLYIYKIFKNGQHFLNHLTELCPAHEPAVLCPIHPS